MMNLSALKMLLPILLVIFSNVFYNISAKLTPPEASSFLSLTITYITAAVLSFSAFCLTVSPKALAAELSKLNIYSVILGISIVGLEIGYIFIYRVGWKISTGSLTANIILACVLVIIGALFFKEHITLTRLIGIVLCGAGLIFLNKA